jgi:hypothetical protein
MPSFLLLPIEQRLLRTFESPALDACRRTLLAIVATGVEGDAQARNIVRRALSTELAALFRGLLTLPVGYLDLPLPTPARLIEIDGAFATLGNRYLAPAIRELGELGAPWAYGDLLRTHIFDASFQNRVAGTCALVLLAGILEDSR